MAPMADADPIELVDDVPDRPGVPQDVRPKMPEPLPVRLVAVADVRLAGRPDSLAKLDGFYVDILGFVRESGDEGPVYRADNFRVLFQIRPDSPREDCRVVRVEVPSLAAAEQKLFAAGVEYTRLRGLVPGTECLTLTDPAGNWLEVVEYRPL